MSEHRHEWMIDFVADDMFCDGCNAWAKEENRTLGRERDELTALVVALRGVLVAVKERVSFVAEEQPWALDMYDPIMFLDRILALSAPALVREMQAAMRVAEAFALVAERSRRAFDAEDGTDTTVMRRVNHAEEVELYTAYEAWRAAREGAAR